MLEFYLNVAQAFSAVVYEQLRKREKEQTGALVETCFKIVETGFVLLFSRGPSPPDQDAWANPRDRPIFSRKCQTGCRHKTGDSQIAFL
jgi:hypothetical protein